jgi:hypothetical protein
MSLWMKVATKFEAKLNCYLQDVTTWVQVINFASAVYAYVHEVRIFFTELTSSCIKNAII